MYIIFEIINMCLLSARIITLKARCQIEGSSKFKTNEVYPNEFLDNDDRFTKMTKNDKIMIKPYARG